MGHMHAGMENQYCILMDQYQNKVTLYILNQKCMIFIEKSKYRDVYSGCDTLSLQILFVYYLALPSLLHPLILCLY